MDRSKQLFAASSILETNTNLITHNGLRQICKEILNNKAFHTTTAAVKKHQAYVGGLLVHTAEVMDIALNMASTRCLKANTDILVTAALCHDYGKIWDYKVNDVPLAEGETEFGYTDHAKEIRHLPRSYAEFMILARKYEIDDELCRKISHCILAHHGRKEWGSPVEPISAEAHILHYADMLSAHVTQDYWE